MSMSTAGDAAPLTADQQRLVLQALPKIREVAAWIHRRFPRSDLEELNAVGRLEATLKARTFDPRRDVPFPAYALKAFRGAMIDAAAAQAGLTAAQRELVARMVAGTPEPRDLEGGGGGDSPAARLRAVEEVHDAIAMGAALGVASGAPKDPEVVLIQKQMLAALGLARERLTAEQQRIVQLHHIEGMALEQVGKALGMGRTAIKDRHRLVLVRLRTHLEPWA